MKESSQTIRHSLVIDPGMDKLQELLLAMAPGDELSVARATEGSRRDPSQGDGGLEGRMRAGVRGRSNHGAYARCQLDVTRPVSRTAPAAAVVSRNVLGS